MRRIAQEMGGKCLSTNYLDQRSPLRWQCADGHVWDAVPAQIKGSRNKPGTWCPTCGRQSAARKRAYSEVDMHLLAESHGGAFASDTYQGSQVKHSWHCSEYPIHLEFEMLPVVVTRGGWCPRCAGNAKPTLEDLDALARERHPLAHCLSQQYENSSTPLFWYCGNEGHEPFWRTYRSIKYDGGWCKSCALARRKPKKYDREMCARFASSLGGQLLSDEPYRSTKQKLRWRCADGHEFVRTLDSVLAYHSFCPTCTKKTGLREEYIRQLFSYMFAAPFLRRRDLPWLVNGRGNAMELDGYNPEWSLAFEHNGLQHYEIDGYLTVHLDQLQTRLADDASKIRMCRENGVSLIVIPFSVPLREIQHFVLKELEKLSVEPPNPTTYEPGLVAPSVLQKFREHAENLGGQLLSDRYEGSAGQLLWKCKNPGHPPFLAAPNSVINSGSWCRKCASERQSESYRATSDDVQNWASNCNGALASGAAANTDLTFALMDIAQFRCLLCGRTQARTIRQVKDGRLCLCASKKTRIDRPAVERALAERHFTLAEPLEILGGSAPIKIRCDTCGTQWTAKASNAVNDETGCPKCRRNASITVEKARELGDRIGFRLRSAQVSSGKQILHWECIECGDQLEKSYREMRNVRRCRACVGRRASTRLGIDHLP